MAITEFTFDANEAMEIAKRAVTILNEDAMGRPYWTYQTYVGKVLYVGEFNEREDSDFYAIVWDDTENKPRRVVYASTRYWSYPARAEVDATPEVLAKYDAYQKALERRARITSAWRARCRMNKLAAEFGLTRTAIKKVLKCYQGSDRRKVIILMTTKVRSEFKKSLKNQIIEWAKQDAPKYNRPLSAKQLGYLPDDKQVGYKRFSTYLGDDECLMKV